jgi:transcriptional regulator with XRE-family HTH domain
MDVREILDAAKKGRQLTSDYALASELEVSRSAVSQWRDGKHFPNAVMCEKLAVFSGIPLHRVLGIVGEARAISAAEKRVWRKLAAALFVGLLITLPAAAKAHFPTNGNGQTMHYAKL